MAIQTCRAVRQSFSLEINVMKSDGNRLALFVVLLLCWSPCDSLALDIYYNNIDADLPGTNITPNGVWVWTAGPDAIFTNEVTASGGVGGTQSFLQTTDASGAVGTSWYFVRGFGQLAVWADQSNPLAGGVAGSNNAAHYRFSVDVNIAGNNGGEGSTPLVFGISASDNNYEANHSIDVNNDGDMLDGAEVYNHGDIKPTVSVSGQWTHISWTFDQGTPQSLDSDIPVQDQQVFSNVLTLQWYASYHSGGFGLDADNVVNMDNFRIEFLPGQNGDFNSNGTVDAADYVVWRKNEGTTNALPNDNGFGGTVGSAHYNLWRSNFGNPVSGSSSGLSNAAVPEPNTLALTALIAAGGCLFAPSWRRRAK
jgi:hypothetical protein